MAEYRLRERSSAIFLYPHETLEFIVLSQKNNYTVLRVAAQMIFRAREHEIDLDRKLLIAAILNITPDSFSDGGDHRDPVTAVKSGIRMINEGADILDVGGESTRPGAAPVSADEEIERVIPVIKELRNATEALISIDTSKAMVAQAAMEAGAHIINDISGFHRDEAMAAVAADFGAGCVAMHMRGTPQTMQQFTDYDDMVVDINIYFAETLKMLTSAGVAEECISLDPGIGFSKTVEQNLELIRRLDAFEMHGRPIFLGPSRKSFIGKTLKIDNPKERCWGTAAAICCGIMSGARILRVHDVREMHEVCDMTAAIVWHE